jgi:hypothetical protein
MVSGGVAVYDWMQWCCTHEGEKEADVEVEGGTLAWITVKSPQNARPHLPVPLAALTSKMKFGCPFTACMVWLSILQGTYCASSLAVTVE